MPVTSSPSSILFVTPLIWSLPTGLMVGELAAALPAEGGFYVWVRRAMGPFWGFQEAWLSLVASIFDMAIYPTLFVLYLGGSGPASTAGIEALRLRAAHDAGLSAVEPVWAQKPWARGSILLGALMLSPFALITVYAFFRHLTVGSNAAGARQSSYRNSGGHVELYGLGQRFHGGQ